jgi:hypothetical protein
MLVTLVDQSIALSADGGHPKLNKIVCNVFGCSVSGQFPDR